MKFAFLLFALLFFSSATAQEADVPVVKFDKVNALLENESDQIQVINFWATWCAPCIKELPHFENALQTFGDKIDLHLISLDFADQLDKVNAFVTKKNLQGNVLILDELDYDLWINKIDKSWSGAIPATLFLNPVTGKRIFVESELSADEIKTHINSTLN
jgi:thiol-disulfide isomerase/thioredoxin